MQRRSPSTRVALPLAFAFAAAFVVACDGDEGRPTYPSYERSLLDLARGDADLSTFVDLVTTAGLDEALGKTQLSVTVFAPSNAAFSALPADRIAALRASPSQLSWLLRFQMTGGTRKVNLLNLSSEIQTITSTTILVERNGTTVTLVDHSGGRARIVKTDQLASNGVLHVVDAVLTPPPMPIEAGTILEELAANETMIFRSLIRTSTKTGFDETLEMDGPYTLFAPTNAAFLALGDVSSVSSEILTNILLHHIVADRHSTAELRATPDAVGLSLAKTPLSVAASGTSITINGISLETPVDVPAKNGVLHAVSGVILPPTGLAYASAETDLTSFASAALRAGAQVARAMTPDTLAGERPVTILVPTNGEWIDRNLDVPTVGTSTLATIVQTHTILGQVLIADLADGDRLTTLGSTLTVSVHPSGEITLRDDRGHEAHVAAARADIRTRTGAVHVVYGILGP